MATTFKVANLNSAWFSYPSLDQIETIQLIDSGTDSIGDYGIFKLSNSTLYLAFIKYTQGTEPSINISAQLSLDNNEYFTLFQYNTNQQITPSPIQLSFTLTGSTNLIWNLEFPPIINYVKFYVVGLQSGTVDFSFWFDR